MSRVYHTDIFKDPAFAAVLEFAETTLIHGRGEGACAPLFAGQLNAHTRRIPACTADDAGMFLDNPELSGCQPFCQNLLFDLGLLDVLRLLTRFTGSSRFDAARQEYLRSFLSRCRHPKSGYIPWGEHAGYDLVRDALHVGRYKGAHEVKVMNVPWDQLWDASPEATRHEIEVAFYNHATDPLTLAFNRHANMDGRSNLGGEPCSLSSSGGLYLQAWAWLYKKTGECKFLDWTHRINCLCWDNRSPTTGLFPTGEDRPEELWYGEPVLYACFLLNAAEILGPEGAEFREQALAYLMVYDEVGYDPVGPGFYDTVNVVTGKPVTGPSKHYPDISRPRYMETWRQVENSVQLPMLVTTAAIAYSSTGDARLLGMFDRYVRLLEIDKSIGQGVAMASGDAAGVLHGLALVAERSHEKRYMELASALADYVLERNVTSGLFNAGVPGGWDYYAARAGSNDLALALLAFAMLRQGASAPLPSIRAQMGRMAW